MGDEGGGIVCPCEGPPIRLWWHCIIASGHLAEVCWVAASKLLFHEVVQALRMHDKKGPNNQHAIGSRE